MARSRRARAALVGGECGAIAAGVAGCGVEDDRSSTAAVTLRHAEQSGESSAVGYAVRAFTEDLTRRTDGMVSFEIFWNAAPVPGPETLSAVGSGLADEGGISPAYHPQALPVSNWAGELFATRRTSVVSGVLQPLALSHEVLLSPAYEAASFSFVVGYARRELDLRSELFAGDGRATLAGVQIMEDPSLRAALDDLATRRLATLADTAPAGVQDPRAIVDGFGVAADEWRAAVTTELRIEDDRALSVRDQFAAAKDLDLARFAELVEARRR